MVELLLKEEVFRITGAAMEVYNELGSGFLEAVYQEALGIEFGLQKIPFESQKELAVNYKGQRLEKSYYADFLAFEKIVVEIKAVEHLTSREESQLLNYLNATGLEVGLLVNFGATGRLEWKRMVETRNKPMHANRT